MKIDEKFYISAMKMEKSALKNLKRSYALIKISLFNPELLLENNKPHFHCKKIHKWITFLKINRILIERKHK